MTALKIIDENGVPFHNQSAEYGLMTEERKKYPMKYVVTVVDHIANGAEIFTESFNRKRLFLGKLVNKEILYVFRFIQIHN